MKKPSWMIFSVSRRCNARCIICSNWDTLTDGIPYTEFLRVLEKIVSWAGPIPLTLTGGEPLMYYGLLEIIERASNLGCFVEVITNGILLKENARDLESAGVKRVSVSLDSHHPQIVRMIRGMDIFDKVLEGIDAVSVPVRIATIVLRSNAWNLKGCIGAMDFGDEIILRALKLTNPDHTMWHNSIAWPEEVKWDGIEDLVVNTKAHLDLMKDYYNFNFKHGCTADFDRIWVTATGDVKFCDFEEPVCKIDDDFPEWNFETDCIYPCVKGCLSDFLTLLDDEYKLVKVSIEGDETILRFEK